MSAFVHRKGDDRLIFALAAGQTYRGAADHAGVSERTARRRMTDPTFRQAVADARAEMFSQAVGALAASSVKAAATLHSLLSAGSETARLGAARAILEAGPRLRESEELAARIEELERRAELTVPKPLRRTA